MNREETGKEVPDADKSPHKQSKEPDKEPDNHKSGKLPTTIAVIL